MWWLDKRLTVQRINATVLGRQFRVTFSKSTAFKRSWSFWILVEMRKCKSTWGSSFFVVSFLVCSMHSHWKTSLRLQIIDKVRSAVNAHDKFVELLRTTIWECLNNLLVALWSYSAFSITIISFSAVVEWILSEIDHISYASSIFDFILGKVILMSQAGRRNCGPEPTDL